MAQRIRDVAHELGFAVDQMQEGYFTGGTLGRRGPRILLEEIQSVPLTPYERWTAQDGARHCAVLALIVLAIMALITGGR